MIFLFPGKWSCKAGRLLTCSRVFTNRGRPTPIVIARFRHVGHEPGITANIPPVAAETRKLVRVCCERTHDAWHFAQGQELGIARDDLINAAAAGTRNDLWRELSPHISVRHTENPDGGVTFTAELWIAEEAK